MNIGYARISTLKQSHGTSLDYQTQKINEFCKLHDIPLSNVHTEIDSGGNDDRKVLGYIKELIRTDIIKTLICWKVDRLGRTMLSSLQFIELCKNHSVRVITISDSIDTNNENSSLILNLLLSIATEEKRIIGVRCNSGCEMLWNNNKIPYSKLPYGYIRKGRKIIMDEEIKPIIQFIFKKFNLFSKMKHLTKTKRTQRLLKVLKAKGYQYKGVDFKWWNIKTILSHPLYSGTMEWRGEVKNSSYPTMVSKRLFNQIQTSL
jgi:site-specific DNA recombinase